MVGNLVAYVECHDNKCKLISPSNYLVQHPSVSECCVLGLPDKDYGEVVCAIIIPDERAKKNGEENSLPAITLGELQEWAKDKLATYKVSYQFSFNNLNFFSIAGQSAPPLSFIRQFYLSIS